jgi:hypothetical protein
MRNDTNAADPRFCSTTTFALWLQGCTWLLDLHSYLYAPKPVPVLSFGHLTSSAKRGIIAASRRKSLTCKQAPGGIPPGFFRANMSGVLQCL